MGNSSVVRSLRWKGFKSGRGCHQNELHSLGKFIVAFDLSPHYISLSAKNRLYLCSLSPLDRLRGLPPVIVPRHICGDNMVVGKKEFVDLNKSPENSDCCI